MPLNALSRPLCWMPRALSRGALWDAARASLNTTKRTLQAALWEAARAWGCKPCRHALLRLSASTTGYMGSHGFILMVITHHKHYTHTPHMHTSCTHLHGHSRTIHSLRRSHTTRDSVGGHAHSLAHTHVRTQSCTRSLAHSRTHLLLQSFTPIHFYTLYEKIIFTCGVIRSLITYTIFGVLHYIYSIICP